MHPSLGGLSKRDLVSILETIEFARSSSGHAHVKDLILRVKDILEADFAVCGLGKVHPEGPSDIITVINGNYPGEWLDNYLKEGFYRSDPLVRYHMRFSTPQSWGEIFKGFEDPETRRLIGMAWDFGIRHGVSTGIYIPDGERFSLFCFGGRKDVYGERHKKIMDSLTLYLNKALFKAAPGIGIKPDGGRPGRPGRPVQ